MHELLSQLGIDWKLLIAQIINFLVLLAVLYKFLYKPVISLMDKRSRHIEESLKKAEKIEEKLKETESQKEETLARARAEAQDILKKAKSQAEASQKEIMEAAKNNITDLTAKARREIDAKKTLAVLEAKKDIAGLVIASVKKIVGSGLDHKLNEKLITDIVKDAEKTGV